MQAQLLLQQLATSPQREASSLPNGEPARSRGGGG